MELLQRSMRAARWIPLPVAPVVEVRHPEKSPKPAELARAVDPLIPEVPFPRIIEIQKLCAQYFEITRTELISHRRTAPLCHARHVAVYLSKILTPHSLPEIGRRFGKRDHTTALHSVRKIEGLVAGGDPQTCTAIAKITAVLVPIVLEIA